jgi:phosphoribosylaminoimidazole-succinocarboxamide synthase
MNAISEYSELSIAECPLIKKGKVRDIYQIGNDLLMVATDRISAFDYVLPNPIPQKGIILTQISNFWFDQFKNIIENHLIVTDFDAFPEVLQPYRASLEGRSIIVKKTKVFPVECVVRGYLAGSGYKEYTASGSVCGINLPAGLQKGSRLPETIFTPSTKAESGHDENITADQAIDIIGKKAFTYLRDKSIELYETAHAFALGKGIIIADTKFEFGMLDSSIILIDEILTPDSSRFWPMNEYTVGQEQKSYDKQFVRDYLESIRWDKKPPVPELPEEIISKTSQKYFEAYKKLAGNRPLF